MHVLAARGRAAGSASFGTGGGAGSAGSGGTRTAWPGASRVAASARLPSTRIWPVRQSFWMAPWVTAGEVAAEPAVQADFGLVLGDRAQLDAHCFALPPQSRPVLEPAGELALEALVARAVELGALHAVREVVLAGEAVLRVVVVVVAGAVAERLHQLGGRVQDVRGRHQAAGLSSRWRRRPWSRCRARSIWARCRDRRSPGRSRARPPGCRAARRPPRRPSPAQRLRVGEADILGGEADQAAGDVAGVLAAGEHAGEPVERRVRVGAAQRLMQRGDEVVVLLAILVVERGAAADHLGEAGGVQLGSRRQREQLLGHVQHVAAVAVRHGAERGAGVGQDRQRAAGLRFRALQQLFERRLVEAAEHEDLAAGQQRAVQGEGGVLGGGADEDDRAVLDHGQEAVLLGAVEAVHLVDEQQGALAGVAPAPGVFEGALEVGDAGEHGRERRRSAARRRAASSRAIVVLPTPGGPQRISEASAPRSSMRVSVARARRPGGPGRRSRPAGSAAAARREAGRWRPPPFPERARTDPAWCGTA